MVVGAGSTEATATLGGVAASLDPLPATAEHLPADGVEPLRYRNR